MEYLTTADVWKMTLISLGAVTTVIAYWICTQSLFPHFTRRTQEAYARPWLVLGLGLAATLIIGLITTLFLRIGHGMQFVGTVIGAAGVFLALAGGAGLARRVGMGMLSPLDKDQPWRRTLRGGIAVGLLLIMPFLSYFVTAPAVLVMGLGATILALHRRRQEKAAQLREASQDADSGLDDI